MELKEDTFKDLSSIQKWTMFFAIMGIIGIGIMIMMGLLAMIFSSLARHGNTLPFNPGIFGLIYLLLGLIYIFPVIYLFRFSELTKKALVTSDGELMGTALKNLKSHFKFVGIFTITLLSLYILIILGLIIFKGDLPFHQTV